MILNHLLKRNIEVILMIFMGLYILLLLVIFVNLGYVGFHLKLIGLESSITLFQCSGLFLI